jgi:universal stress protein A
MSLYHHILLAVNLDPDSQKIALKAQALARYNQAKLSLIYVLDVPPALDMGYEASLAHDLTGLLKENAKTTLANFVEKLQLELHQQWVIEGNSVEETIRIAKENHVDLIVMGSHGKNGLALLFGSTSNTMLHHARCDVLAVRLRDES